MNIKKGLITTGLLLIVAALCLTTYNVVSDMQAARKSQQALLALSDSQQGSDTQSDTPKYILNPQMDMPTQEVDSIEYIGTIEIPSLQLELPVISQWSDVNLKVAPCRYRGSAYLDNMIICAHNSKSHFANLKDLSQGDTVIFTDLDNNVFTYEVEIIETLESTAIEEMESGNYDLTLFTCTIGGYARVTVRCESVNR